MSRSCKSCGSHVPGMRLEDVPSHCWDCTSVAGRGGTTPLPYWTPKELPPLEFELVPKEAPEVIHPLPYFPAHKGYPEMPRPVPIIAKAPASPLPTQVGGDHYKVMAIQPMEFAMANNLNMAQANIVKYVTRKKGDLKKQLEDLDKAVQCIEIQRAHLQAGAADV